MNEADFQKILRRQLASQYDCDLDKIHGNMYQSGLPDLVGVTGFRKLGVGRAVYIECKVLDIPVKFDSIIKINVSALQLHTLQKKKKLGAIALIACLVVMKDNKKICLFLPPTNDLKDPKYGVTKQILMEHVIKCINGKAIGVAANKIIYL